MRGATHRRGRRHWPPSASTVGAEGTTSSRSIPPPGRSTCWRCRQSIPVVPTRVECTLRCQTGWWSDVHERRADPDLAGGDRRLHWSTYTVLVVSELAARRAERAAGDRGRTCRLSRRWPSATASPRPTSEVARRIAAPDAEPLPGQHRHLARDRVTEKEGFILNAQPKGWRGGLRHLCTDAARTGPGRGGQAQCLSSVLAGQEATISVVYTSSPMVAALRDVPAEDEVSRAPVGRLERHDRAARRPGLVRAWRRAPMVALRRTDGGGRGRCGSPWLGCSWASCRVSSSRSASA